MTSTCSKCGAKNAGTFAGFNPCHLRTPVEDHNFGQNTGTIIFESVDLLNIF
jgi:hypothetical protein